MNINLDRLIKNMPISMSLWRYCESHLYSQYASEIVSPILDLGCGDGIFADGITSKTIDTGIDISDLAAKRAQKLNKYKQIYICNAEKLPFKDNMYNTVISNCVLEHISNIEFVLSEVFRVLRPGGKFIFTVPSDKYGELLFGTMILRKFGLNTLAKIYINFVNKIGKQIHCWSIPQWKDILQSKGFKILLCRYFMPDAAMRIYDLMGVFRPFMLLNLFLFGKRTILPRNIHCEIWNKTFERIVSLEPKSGGGLWIMTQKI